MNITHKISRSMGLTPHEGRIVLFLAAALVAGGAIKLYLLAAGPAHRYDYHATDSVFLARSRAAARDSGAPAERDLSAASGDSIGDDAGAADTASRVCLNTAGKKTLMSLPAVGETIAERILEYRREHGGFKTMDELMNVRGIGKKTYERIAPYISL